MDTDILQSDRICEIEQEIEFEHGRKMI